MIIIVSATPDDKPAVDLGLVLVEDRRGPPSPRGGTGHVKWEAPEGLLRIVDGSGWFDDEAGSGRRYEVISGPHAGRIVKQYDGSGWFQPSLRWVTR